MGASYGSQKKKPIKIVMSGLNGSGKSTIIEKLGWGFPTILVPVVGINVERISNKDESVSVTSWDVANIVKPYQSFLIRHYCQDIHALIWVIDSLNVDKKDHDDGLDTTTKDELHQMLNYDELRDVVLLICCNKQDLTKHAMDICDIFELLELENVRNEWRIQACAAKSRDHQGLNLGLGWMINKIKMSKTKYKGYDDGKEFVSFISKKNAVVLVENRKKSMLLISCWVRKVSQEYEIRIPSHLAQLIHEYYRNFSK